MDKVEYKLRSDEIKKLIQQKDFAQAAEIADTIDWRRVKSVMMLCTISDVYKINRRFENAKDLLLLAYDRRPGGRSIVYSLCELCLRTGDLVQAMEYYKEFINVAPKDPGRYILQYKIYEDQDVSLEERIEVLEELKKHDYTEKWAYELAYLYHRVGLATRCVEECDEMIACFGDGDYVVKAMELKMLHQPLSADQQKVYDHRFDPKPEEDFLDEEDSPEEEDTGHFSEDIPERNLFADEEEPEGNTAVWTREAVEKNVVSGDTIVYEPIRVEDLSDSRTEVAHQEEPASSADDEEEFYSQEITVNAEEDEPDIYVKTMDVGQYNTINLQAALAQELKPYLDDVEEADQDNEPIEEDEADEPEAVDENAGFELREDEVPQPEENIDEVEDSEVFFGETGEINMNRQTVQANEELYEAKMAGIEPPRAMAGVLSQESDGQLRIVLPQNSTVEKQITGQMDIEDVLAEWERMKKENEEKRKEEVRRHVLQQTGSMFTEFEAAVRDGLLEKLEKDDSTTAFHQTDEDIFADASVEDLFGEAEEFAEMPEIDDVVTEEEKASEIAAEEDQLASEDDSIEETAAEEEEPAVSAEDDIEETAAEEEEPAVSAEDDIEETAAEEEEPAVSAEDDTEEAAAEEEEPAVSTEDDTEEEKASQDVSDDEQGARAVKEKVRPMTREEREHFSAYIQSRETREQIVRTIDNVSLAAYTGNVIITGEVDVDTIPLAKKIIREIQSNDSNFSGQVAKISGHGLSQKNMDETIDRLQNGALIVQQASAMEEQTVQDLHKALQRENLGIVVVLQDDTKSMDAFLEQHAFLREEFTARIDVKALSNDMLVSYGKQYAKEQECSIDELGVLALHNRIEKRQSINHAVNIAEVREIVDQAIRHAKRLSVGHYVSILVGKRYDDEDMIIITEKDFI